MGGDGLVAAWSAPSPPPGEEHALVVLGEGPSPDLVDQAARGLAPKLDYIELARMIDGRVMSYQSRVRGRLAKLAGKAPLLASSLAAFLERERFSAIYTTGEDIGLRLAPLLRLSGWSGRLITVVHSCISKRRKAAVRALGEHGFDALICVCEAQRRILVEDVGLPAEKVHGLRYWVDTDFYDPQACAPDRGATPFVFSCGLENRDYPTLIEAARELPYPFKIAASGFWGENGAVGQSVPPNVRTFRRRVSFPELRRAYRNCRFVVVPLHAAAYAAGLTGMMEAMAMEKPVIVTASPGVADYVEDGVSGLVTPPGDPKALAAAIAELWNAPERCREIGRRNRAWAEANASIEIYVRRASELISPGRLAAQPG